MKYFSKDPHKILYRVEATHLFSCVLSRGVLKVIGVILMTVEHCQSKRLCLQTSNLRNPPILFIWINPSSENDRNLNQNKHSAHKLQAH